MPIRLLFGKSSGNTLRDRWRDFFEILFFVFILALFLRTYFFGFYRVTTENMSPTLLMGDFVWTSKSAYGLKIPFRSEKLEASYPNRGDIVVVKQPLSSSTLMRVIGVPGDHILGKDHKVYVNEQLLSLVSTIPAAFGPLLVPPGEVLVIVDQADSIDASFWKLIPLSQVESKVLGVWFSLIWDDSTIKSNGDKVTPQIRWDRIRFLSP